MPFTNKVKCLDGSMGETACGLVVKTDEGAVGVPLVSVSAKIDIVNVAAEVTLEQTFVNNSPDLVQCVYFFPTEDRVALHSFAATLDERRLTGVVKDKETAREDFIEAVENNKTAFLLEEIKPDIMELYIGNLNAGSTCVIQIKYVQELGVQEFAPRFTLPTTIAPRYIPPSDPNPEIAKANYQFQTLQDVPLSIQVEALMRTPIKSIKSPTHAVVANIQDTKGEDGFYHATTELMVETTSMDRDFVLIMDCEDPLKEVVIVEKTEGEEEIAITVSFVPKFNAAEINCEFIFLIDCSGSMSGGPIGKARDALNIFLQSLPEDCYFNIYRFGSRYETLFPRSVQYDEANLSKAKKYAKTMQADLGGTEILTPIKDILPGGEVLSSIKNMFVSNMKGYRKQVFIVTDGQVSNTSAVTNHIADYKGDGRVFSLGIGDSASRELVKGVASSGDGVALFCTLVEPMHEKVIQLLSNAVASSTKLIDIECTMGNATTLVLSNENKATDKEYQDMHSPDLPMTMFSRNKITFHMLLKEVPSSISYICKTETGQAVEYVSLAEFCLISTDKIHKLVAHEIVRCKGSQGRLSRSKDETTDNLCRELAVKYGIVSPFTSFICVDETQAKVSYSQDVKSVTSLYEEEQLMSMNLACAGFLGGGSGGQERFRSANSSLGATSFYGSSKKKSAGLPNPLGFVGSAVRSLKMFSKKRSLVRSSAPMQLNTVSCASPSFDNEIMEDCSDDSAQEKSCGAQPELHNDDAKLVKILDLSDSKGMFSDLAALCNVIGRDLQLADDVQKRMGITTEVFTTMLVLQYLEMFYSNNKTSWAMIEKKSRTWLNQQITDDVKIQDIKDTIKIFLKS